MKKLMNPIPKLQEIADIVKELENSDFGFKANFGMLKNVKWFNSYWLHHVKLLTEKIDEVHVKLGLIHERLEKLEDGKNTRTRKVRKRA